MPFLNFNAKRFLAFEDYDAASFPIGTKIADASTGDYYTLRVSSHAVDAEHVAVRGNVNLRWIKDPPPAAVGTGNTWTVAVDGSDDNDGIAAPLKTLERAAILCQLGGGGTIVAEDYVWASPRLGGGLKLLGASDTGIGLDLDEGWIEVNNPMTFRFEGNPERFKQGWGASYIAPGGGAGTSIEPVLWIAGTVQALTFENAQFWTDSPSIFPTVRLGLSSPLAPWDAGKLYDTTAAVTYGGKPYDKIASTTIGDQPDISPAKWQLSRDNLVNGDNLGAAQTVFCNFKKCQFIRVRQDVGPALDLGLTFWDYYEKCLFTKIGYSADPGTDNPILNCAIRNVSTARGAGYLQYLTECQFDGAGIYSSGETSGVINGASYEDAIFPLFYAENSAQHGTGSATRWDLYNVDVNDGPFGEIRAAVNASSGVVYATRCAPSYGRVIETNPTSPTSEPTDRLTYGQSGPTLLLQQDSARRGYGPVASKYPNVAWQAPSTATFVAAPDGSNTAFAAGGVIHTMFDESDATQTLVDGDRLIFGVWNRWDTGGAGAGNYITNSGSGNITVLLGGFVSKQNQEVTLIPGEAFRWLGDIPSSIGQWAWSWAWLKVIAKGTGAVAITANTSTTGALWRPNAQIIPAADALISDSEAAYLAMHSAGPATVRKFGAPDTIVTPAVGTVAMWPGQKIAFWDATLSAWKYLDIDNGAARIT